MPKKLVVLIISMITLVSCQLKETMTLNEDGSGRMSVSMDLGEMMSMTGEFAKDTTAVKMDTIVPLMSMLEEKKDSISKLPKAQRDKLMAMKNYKIRTLMDSEAGEMLIDIIVDFKDISEANKLLEGFDQADGIIPGTDKSGEGTKEEKPQVVGVDFSYKRGVFKRDAFIKNVEVHSQQMDSIKQMEAFLGDMNYAVEYTFPRRIKSTSLEGAIISEDGKTISFKAKFLDYFKNPDLLDIEVKLEKK